MGKKKSLIEVNEDYLQSLLEEIIEKKEIQLKKEDANLIIKSIMTEIDLLIAKKIKTHFVELAKFIFKTFKEKK